MNSCHLHNAAISTLEALKPVLCFVDLLGLSFWLAASASLPTALVAALLGLLQRCGASHNRLRAAYLLQ